MCCERELAEEDYEYTYTDDGKVVCHECEADDLSSASQVVIFDPDHVNDEVHPILVGRYFTVDSQYLERVNEPVMQRTWHSTNMMRGAFDTTIEGWTKIISGWTTGWVDETVQRKATFNEWAGALAEQEEARALLPCRVAVIVEQTSNVFSSAVGIHVPDAHVGRFTEWLGNDFEALRYALS